VVGWLWAVIIRDNAPVHWMFTNKAGQIKRKGEAKMGNRRGMVRPTHPSQRSAGDDFGRSAGRPLKAAGAAVWLVSWCR
jgi:hypothetical protein